MKKIKKIVFAALIITGAIVTTSVSAVQIINIVDVTLSSFSGISRTTITSKSVYGEQRVKTTKAKDQITGGGRAISVCTESQGGTTSSWIYAPANTLVGWDSAQANGNYSTGSYMLKVKASKSTLAKVTYSGTWYIDSQGW